MTNENEENSNAELNSDLPKGNENSGTESEKPIDNDFVVNMVRAQMQAQEKDQQKMLRIIVIVTVCIIVVSVFFQLLAFALKGGF